MLWDLVVLGNEQLDLMAFGCYWGGGIVCFILVGAIPKFESLIGDYSSRHGSYSSGYIKFPKRGNLPASSYFKDLFLWVLFPLALFVIITIACALRGDWV